MWPGVSSALDLMFLISKIRVNLGGSVPSCPATRFLSSFKLLCIFLLYQLNCKFFWKQIISCIPPYANKLSFISYMYFLLILKIQRMKNTYIKKKVKSVLPQHLEIVSHPFGMHPTESFLCTFINIHMYVLYILLF